MKKIITLDSIMVSFVGAIGYGYGYVIPSAHDLHPAICLLICLVLGGIMEAIADKIVFSKFIQENNVRRIVIFICIALIFTAGYIWIANHYAYSLWSDVGVELFYSIVIPIIAFIVSLVVKAIKKKKLQKKYGTGESGFQIDEKAKEELKFVIGINSEVAGDLAEGPVVKTYGGNYIGKKERSIVYFLGIPYAKAPVGDMRWEKPVPIDASDKTFEAYYFGNSEIQPIGTHNVLSEFNQDEDCLSLNVLTSKLEPNAKKPVFVYFPGGDGRYGGSANPAYYLFNLAKKIPDAVFVSFNYRIGLFGTVAFDASDCLNPNEFEDSAILPLLDQIEALKWIKANISAFGGDPDNINVAGDTMGGNCICLLATVKDAKNLFKRALIMSSSSFDSAADLQPALTLGKKLMTEYKVKNAEELKKISSEELRDFIRRYYEYIEYPARDDKIVPLDIEKEYLNGSTNGIEFIYGIAADDISAWKAMLAGDVPFENIIEKGFNDLKSSVGKSKASKIDDLVQQYVKSGLTMLEAEKTIMSDYQLKACAIRDCKALAMGGNDVRCFYWDASGAIEEFTANTASMVTCILGNSKLAEQIGYLNDKDLTEVVQTFIDKFIHGEAMELYNNEIKGVQSIVWDKFDSDKMNVLFIQNDKIAMSDTVFDDKLFALDRILHDE